MKVLFFHYLKDLTGCSELLLPTTGEISPEDFWLKLLELHPALESFRSSTRLACNETYLQPDVLLKPNDTIALIPPASGG